MGKKTKKNSNANTRSHTTTATSNRQTWHFHALDTLFFRESRPMDSKGNSELGSLFPPSVRTLIGAVRSALGEANEIDWHEYHDQKQQHPLAALIGYGDDLAALHFSGVWIYKDGERLYPAPQNIMQKVVKPAEQGQPSVIEKIFFLTIDDELTRCDLGTIRLPKLEKQNAGSKSLADIWLTASEFKALLMGRCPMPKKWVTLSDLLVEEARIGIARDNQTRSVEKGRLYQTKHIRLADDVRLAIDIAGIDDKQWQSTPPDFMRLGGEGRVASIHCDSPPAFIAAPTIKHKERKIALYLLTPMLINSHEQSETWQPLPDFKEAFVSNKKGKQKDKQAVKQKVWVGTLHGIELTLHTAITGKAHREGGWDLATQRPKAVQSYIPAGSVFYCTTTTKPKKVIEALHGKCIGHETNKGRGMLAVGKWV